MQQEKSVRKTARLTKTALFAAVICIIGPIAIPIGFSPVPITLCSFIIYLFAYCLSAGEIVIGTAVYLLLGAVGLPVFAGAQGGLGVLFGPTGGYLIAYPLLALVCAWFDAKYPKKRAMQLMGMLMGTALLYIFGTVWFAVGYQNDWISAFTVCVLPYFPMDLLKMAAAVSIGPIIVARLRALKRGL